MSAALGRFCEDQAGGGIVEYTFIVAIVGLGAVVSFNLFVNSFSEMVGNLGEALQ
jgi:Flp pilus assembly pilin Flp